jgi:hypothetical protein
MLKSWGGLRDHIGFTKCFKVLRVWETLVISGVFKAPGPIPSGLLTAEQLEVQTQGHSH